MRLAVSVLGDAVDRVDADVAVVACLEDERPLRGAAARADWRLCGALSALLADGSLAGRDGDAALFPSGGGVRAPRVLALGLGARGRRRAERLRAYGDAALARLIGLRARQPALALLPSDYGDVRDQIEELVAGLAERLSVSDAASELSLRLLVPEGALAEAREGLAQLATQRWPEGLQFPDA